MKRPARPRCNRHGCCSRDIGTARVAGSCRIESIRGSFRPMKRRAVPSLHVMRQSILEKVPMTNTILVVDDSPSSVAGLVDAFAASGLTAAGAHGFADAL